MQKFLLGLLAWLCFSSHHTSTTLTRWWYYPLRLFNGFDSCSRRWPGHWPEDRRCAGAVVVPVSPRQHTFPFGELSSDPIPIELGVTGPVVEHLLYELGVVFGFRFPEPLQLFPGRPMLFCFSCIPIWRVVFGLLISSVTTTRRQTSSTRT